MEFLSLSRRRSSSRNVPSSEERGETAVSVGYTKQGCRAWDSNVVFIIFCNLWMPA